MIRAILVLSFALLTPNISEACECIGVQGPFLRPGERGIVATGHVVEIRNGNSTRPPAADVEIREAFLNVESGARITIYGVNNNCAYPLRKGEEYVLATDFVKGPDGFWVNIPPRSQGVTACGRTQMLNSPEGQKMLAAIREEAKRLWPR